MEVMIHAPGMVLGDGFKVAIEQKIGRLEQFESRASRAHVHIHKAAHHSQDQYVVRVLCEVPGSELSAEEKASDPMTALEFVADKIERRLRKRKTARLADRERDNPRQMEKL